MRKGGGREGERERERATCTQYTFYLRYLVLSDELWKVELSLVVHHVAGPGPVTVSIISNLGSVLMSEIASVHA